MDKLLRPIKSRAEIETPPYGRVVAMHELMDVFSADEGSINMYYGLIGNGKTYSATSDILDLLRQGKVVYCNWKIVVDDHDDRKSFWYLFYNFILFKKRFYYIPCRENLYFFDVDDGVYTGDGKKVYDFDGMGSVVEYFSNLNECHIFWDEGQDMFDSYEGTKFSKAKRRLILHTRHFHRTLNIISQRPTAIQVSARGNVNRFYKCVKLASWPWIRFARYEFQEMVGETVDEDAEPISVKRYWASSRVFNSYNTSYLADGIPKSQNVYFTAFDLGFFERLQAITDFFKEKLDSLRPPKPYVPLGIPNARCLPREPLSKWSPDAIYKLTVVHL